MDPLGKSTIPLPFLIAAKLSMILCTLFFIPKMLGVTMLYESPVTVTIGLLLVAVGIIIVALGILFLGKSVSVGLPREKTELKTNGIYHITRNPIYVGAFIACIGSCLAAMHIMNFIFCGICIGIHHWIVTREENFLEERFGEQWVEYKKKTPRYLLY